jgi:uncharacterized repeat protein (TIGR01451 family)
VTVTFSVPSSYVAPDPALVRLSASASTPDPSSVNDVAEAAIAVMPRADLALNLTGPASATPPHQPTYTLTLTNRGPSDAASVQIGYPTPPGLTLVSSGGACPSLFPCALGAVGAGETRSATVTFELPEGYAGPGPIHNAASVTTSTVDPFVADNSATFDTLLEPPPPPLGYYTLTPCRVLDTRRPDGALGGPALLGAEERWFVVTGSCGIPPTARAVAVNATVAGADRPGNLRLWSAGKPVPPTSVVNFAAGQTRGTNAIVGINPFGTLAVKAIGAARVHVILDVSGYFE